MAEFLSMGGYAWYVWPAYAVSLVVILGNIAFARNKFSSTKKHLRGKLRRAERKNS